jgi:hypothetical protein
MLKLEKISPLELEHRARVNLTKLLDSIPSIYVQHIEHYDKPIDFVAHVRAHDGGTEYLIGCEVKSNGQPRYAEAALLHLTEWRAKMPPTTAVVFIAPYLSDAVRAMCSERDVGYLDLSGNCLIKFGQVYIERAIAAPPPAEQRELKSLYKPKSARVLRVLLHEPRRSWKLKDLSAISGVSLGHVSNVRNALKDRNWVADQGAGTILTQPDALLDEWRENYEVEGETYEFYTTLHGSLLKEAIHGNLNGDELMGPVAVLSSYSAADWMAPYGRTSKSYFYADPGGFEKLKETLSLKSVKVGGNVKITIPRDNGVFLGFEQPFPGIICTSIVQTYLDLYASGERGQESAEYLRKEKIKW